MAANVEAVRLFLSKRGVPLTAENFNRAQELIAQSPELAASVSQEATHNAFDGAYDRMWSDPLNLDAALSQDAAGSVQGNVNAAQGAGVPGAAGVVDDVLLDESGDSPIDLSDWLKYGAATAAGAGGAYGLYKLADSIDGMPGDGRIPASVIDDATRPINDLVVDNAPADTRMAPTERVLEGELLRNTDTDISTHVRPDVVDGVTVGGERNPMTPTNSEEELKKILQIMSRKRGN